MVLVREPALNTTKRRAAQVFAEAVICGGVLGFAAMFVAIFVSLVGANSTESWLITLYGPMYAGFGGAAGTVVGVLAGTAGWALVRVGEPRLGARRVAAFLPLAAFAVTLLIGALIALPGDARWRVLVLAIDVALTLIGSLVVTRRYLRRAEWPSVH